MNIRKYTKRFFYQIFCSLILLIALFIFKPPKILNNNINILKSITIITKSLPNYKNQNEQIVNNKIYYENIKYQLNKNILINENNNLVYTLSDGIVIKITKDIDSKYEVFILCDDNYLYTYSNLESCEVGIYSYVKTGTLIGGSSYNKDTNNYNTILIISKDEVFYDYNKIG